MTRPSRLIFWLLTAVSYVMLGVFWRQMASPLSFEHLSVLAALLVAQGS